MKIDGLETNEQMTHRDKAFVSSHALCANDILMLDKSSNDILQYDMLLPKLRLMTFWHITCGKMTNGLVTNLK